MLTHRTAAELSPRRRLRAVALHYSRSAMKAALARGSWGFALVAMSNIVSSAPATLTPNSRCARSLRWAPSVSLLRTTPPALATLGEIGCSQWLRHLLHLFCRLPLRNGAAYITPAAPSVASPRFARAARFPHPPPPRSRLRHCLSQSLTGSVALSRYYAYYAPSPTRWLRSLPWQPSRLYRGSRREVGATAPFFFLGSAWRALGLTEKPSAGDCAPALSSFGVARSRVEVARRVAVGCACCAELSRADPKPAAGYALAFWGSPAREIQRPRKITLEAASVGGLRPPAPTLCSGVLARGPISPRSTPGGAPIPRPSPPGFPSVAPFATLRATGRAVVGLRPPFFSATHAAHHGLLAPPEVVAAAALRKGRRRFSGWQRLAPFPANAGVVASHGQPCAASRQAEAAGLLSARLGAIALFLSPVALRLLPASPFRCAAARPLSRPSPVLGGCYAFPVTSVTRVSAENRSADAPLSARSRDRLFGRPSLRDRLTGKKQAQQRQKNIKMPKTTSSPFLPFVKK